MKFDKIEFKQNELLYIKLSQKFFFFFLPYRFFQLNFLGFYLSTILKWNIFIIIQYFIIYKILYTSNINLYIK